MIIVLEKDVVEKFIKASGPGGQNVNKVASCVQLLHIPTGITVKCQEHRTQFMNRQAAWGMLCKAVEKKHEKHQEELRQAREKKRRQNRRPSLAAKSRMIETKKKRSIKKNNRRGKSLDD